MKRRGFLSGLGQAVGAACAGGVLVAHSSQVRGAQGNSSPTGGPIFADGYEGLGFTTDTFNVTGFGSKSSLPYFEDFEDQAPGAAVSPVGRIHLSHSPGQTISTARAFDGTRSLQNLYSTNPWPHDYLVLSGTRPRFYFSCHLYYSGTLTGARVWKQGRIGAGEVYSGLPHAGESWTANDSLPQHFGGGSTNSNGNHTWSKHNTAAPNSVEVYDLNRWMFYEFEHYSGTVNNSDAVTRATVDGVPVLIWDQRPYLTSATPTLPQWFITVINGLDGDPPVLVNMDRVYADESRARVVFTNSANYGASSLFNIQPIVSYADTQIVTQRNTPSFSLGETVHVHAWTDAGDYRYLGTRLLA